MKTLNELNIKEKNYIIFDMDGTLIDSIGVWNITDQKLIEEYGGPSIDLELIQRKRDAFLHDNLSSDIYLSYCEYLINEYNLNATDKDELLKRRWELSGIILENETDFKPDAANLILRLKELGFTLVLGTMTTQVQLDIYSKKNKKMLSQMDISQVFDYTTRKEDVKRKKPDPEIYNMILKHFNASKEECLVFEDSYTGVLSSKNAGIEVINVYDKYADLDRERINEITDYSIDNYKQFIEYLNSVYNIQFVKEKQ